MTYGKNTTRINSIYFFQCSRRSKDINEIDTLEEYRDNKAAINLQRENLLKQLETAASEKTLINEKQYETESRHSLKSIIQMIENNPDRYIEIGNALREHVSQIVYDKEKDHMTFYLY